MRIGFSKFKKKEKKLLKKRFETTLTQNQLSLDLEKIITVGMKMFFVIFGRICPILSDFGDFFELFTSIWSLLE